MTLTCRPETASTCPTPVCLKVSSISFPPKVCPLIENLVPKVAPLMNIDSGGGIESLMPLRKTLLEASAISMK